MKTFKTIIAIAFLLSLISCSSDNDQETAYEAPFTTTTIESINLNIGMRDGSIELNINSNRLDSFITDRKILTEISYDGELITNVLEKDILTGAIISSREFEYLGSTLNKITKTTPQNESFSKVIENFSYLNDTVTVTDLFYSLSGQPLYNYSNDYIIVDNNVTSISGPVTGVNQPITLTYDTKFNPYSNLTSLKYLTLIFKEKICYNNPTAKLDPARNLNYSYTYNYNGGGFFTEKKEYINQAYTDLFNVYYK